VDSCWQLWGKTNHGEIVANAADCGLIPGAKRRLPDDLDALKAMLLAKRYE
jgi:hypothetical protein